MLATTPLKEYQEHVRDVLRHDSPHIVLGLIVVAIGVTALSLFVLRKRGRDPGLPWFGVFALLYGVRLLLDTDSVPFAIGISGLMARMLRSLLTYAIPVPGLVFGYYVFVGWRRSLRWLIGFSIVFAVAGSAADLVTGSPAQLERANNAIVVAVCVAFAVALFRRRDSVVNNGGLRWGVLAWAITILLSNLNGLGVRGIPSYPEDIGFVCFLYALGRVLALRAFETEERVTALNKELEIATRIQLSILPQEMPDSANLKIAARYLPMTDVAGDFYDFLRVDDQRIGILIADVSGHGVPAALIASMVKIAISAQLPHADDPALVMAGMNQILCGKLQGQFVSAAYLYLDLKERRFRYSAAGHPPLLWWNANLQQVESVEQNGLILGVMNAATYRSTERAMQPGERFLLYTDGLLEAANDADEFFGEHRVTEALAATRSMTAEDCSQALLDRLGEFAGHNRGRTRDDDLTVVVVDITFGSQL